MDGGGFFEGDSRADNGDCCAGVGVGAASRVRVRVRRGFAAADGGGWRCGWSYGCGAQDLRLDHALVDGALVKGIGASTLRQGLRQLGEGDALANRPGWRIAAGRGDGTRRSGLSTSASEQFGAGIVQPRLDVAHSSGEPAARSMQSSCEAQIETETVAEQRGNGDGGPDRRSAAATPAGSDVALERRSTGAIGQAQRSSANTTGSVMRARSANSWAGDQRAQKRKGVCVCVYECVWALHWSKVRTARLSCRLILFMSRRGAGRAGPMSNLQQGHAWASAKSLDKQPSQSAIPPCQSPVLPPVKQASRREHTHTRVRSCMLAARPVGQTWQKMVVPRRLLSSRGLLLSPPL